MADETVTTVDHERIAELERAVVRLAQRVSDLEDEAASGYITINSTEYGND